MKPTEEELMEMKKRPKSMLEDTLIERDRFSAEELQVIDAAEKVLAEHDRKVNYKIH